MRTLKRNKQEMKYALQIGKMKVYERDENGDILYFETSDNKKIPMETGSEELAYSTPKTFKANIAMSGGEAEAKEYGLSTSDYEAVIVYSKGAIPLVEGALVWLKSNVEYKNNGELTEVEKDNGEIVKIKVPEKVSADYQVLKISPSINEEKAILKAINK